MSRENYPRDDGPSMLQFGLFLLLLAAIGFGVFTWNRAQTAVKLEQARAVAAARMAEASAVQSRQSLLANPETGDAGETAGRPESLEDEVKRLRRENELLRNKLEATDSAMAEEP